MTLEKALHKFVSGDCVALYTDAQKFLTEKLSLTKSSSETGIRIDHKTKEVTITLTRQPNSRYEFLWVESVDDDIFYSHAIYVLTPNKKASLYESLKKVTICHNFFLKAFGKIPTKFYIGLKGDKK